MKRSILLVIFSASFIAARVEAQTFTFSTGLPDGRMATASRTDTPGSFEIESADDFVLTSSTQITGATFTGLLPSNFNLSSISQVQVEIYRVFPNDSNVARTSGPPTFSTAQVPTRVNSPSDVAFDSRNSLSGGGLTFMPALLSANFTANNSILPGGIHPSPNQATGGNGPVTGEEVQFNVTFTTPFNLPADHYFFVPQVDLTAGAGNFLWLSAPRPIVPPGTPFPPGFTDLQAWTRDANLDPDWLRQGTDIVDTIGTTVAPTFNETFSLVGTVP
ncbi:MAG TPA: hypothetical protein VGH08_10120, partial [Chthoniobacterales bacterium]